jgi:hypothetical protein
VPGGRIKHHWTNVGTTDIAGIVRTVKQKAEAYIRVFGSELPDDLPREPA